MNQTSVRKKSYLALGEDAMQAISERLLAERLRLGFTQQEFASKVGVCRYSQALYEGTEGATRLPDWAYALRAAEIGVDVMYVLFGIRASTPNTELEGQADQPSAITVSDDVRKVMHNVKRANEQTARLRAWLKGAGTPPVSDHELLARVAHVCFYVRAAYEIAAALPKAKTKTKKAAPPSEPAQAVEPCKTVAQVKQELFEQGTSVSEWARTNGVERQVVFDLLRGQIKGARGQAHKAAVLLGLKHGTVSPAKTSTKPAKGAENQKVKAK